MIDKFFGGPTVKQQELDKKLQREREIAELKQAGWQTTTDLPFSLMDTFRNDPAVRIGAQGSLANFVYSSMAEVLGVEGEEYESQNVRIITKQKFLSPDFISKIEAKARARFAKKNPA